LTLRRNPPEDQPTVTMQKRAIISGITGQDGSYLAELLLEQGYHVVGITRRTSAPNYWRIEHLLDRIELKVADLLDQLSLIRAISDVRPHEFYNLAAMSFVPASWEQPFLTGEFNSQGVTRVLEAIRHVDPSIRVYQASSSEMFGKVREVPQKETTPFHPRSRTGSRRCSGTTSRSTIAKATGCLPARASCSTTNPRGAASSS
jgi:GDPmannose 4,6-dehydratase